MNTTDLLLHSLKYGAILSVLLSILFMGLLFVSPASWVSDYPPDIKERFGEMNEQAKRWKRIAIVPIMLVMVGVPIWSIVRLVQLAGPTLTFWDIALSVFITATTFNLVDLVILDWLIFVRLQPKAIVLPGTEGMAGYRDYTFHLIASLKGEVGIAVVSLVFAAVTMLFV